MQTEVKLHVKDIVPMFYDKAPQDYTDYEDYSHYVEAEAFSEMDTNG